MAKSKRAKVVHLSKTEKKGKEGKSKLIDQIHQVAVPTTHIYLFRVRNMRNSLFKELRTALAGRFFIGKNKVMALALGLDEASECLPGVAHLARRLRGDLGLLFTDLLPSQVLQLCASHEAEDYARTTNKATVTVVIEADEAGLRNVETGERLSATLEPQLRQAGLPTKLRGGLVLLASDSYTVCREGERLTVDQARILKAFGIKMATFSVQLLAHYHDGSFEEYEEVLDSESDSGNPIDGDQNMPESDEAEL